MKRVFRVIASGPWSGGLSRDMNIPADSAEEASQIAREVFGASSTVGMGCWGPYTGPDSLNQRPDPNTGAMFARCSNPSLRRDEFGNFR